MLKRKVPPRLWDYGLVYETNILNRIPCGKQQRTGIEIVTGKTPNISEWIAFEFYDRVAGVPSHDGSVSHTESGATYVTCCYSSLAR